MSFFRYIRITRLAMKSLLLHKLRSALTMLGIVIGVFSVIAMLAIGEGASNQAQEQVLKLGATNIIVRSVKPPSGTSSASGSRTQEYGLRRSDFELLVNIPTVFKGIRIREAKKEARYLRNSMNIRTVGCTPEYMAVNHLELAKGRFITAEDQRQRENVAVIAYEVAQKLFPHEEPLGKPFRVDVHFFKIVGVTKDRTASAAIGGSMSGQDFNKDVYIPLETYGVIIGDTITDFSPGSFSSEKVELNQITLQLTNDKDVIPTANVVRETLEMTHGTTRDYAIVVPMELLKQAAQIRNIFNVVLGSVACLSLVVGGIGIMNIMLANVTERTREIGIRRALGAKQSDITIQFLSETVVLSGVGGLLGVIFGLLTPYTFQLIQWISKRWVLTSATIESEVGRIFADMHPEVAWWSLPLAFGISVAIGIASGLYPAMLAARLDPIEALRHE